MAMAKKFDVFLSYARPDASVARALATSLKKRGASVWFDSAELALGDDWASAIERNLASSKTVVFLVSDSFRRSQWSNYEMGVALGKSEASDIRIIPVLLKDADPSALPSLLRSYQFLKLAPSAQAIEQVADQVVQATNQGGEG
jgi:TIR domain-containing protein